MHAVKAVLPETQGSGKDERPWPGAHYPMTMISFNSLLCNHWHRFFLKDTTSEYCQEGRFLFLSRFPFSAVGCRHSHLRRLSPKDPACSPPRMVGFSCVYTQKMVEYCPVVVGNEADIVSGFMRSAISDEASLDSIEGLSRELVPDQIPI
jgi:hypothetical protein